MGWLFFTKLQEDYTGRDSLGNLQLGDRKSSSNLGSCAPHKQILLGKKEVLQESPKSLYLGAALYNIMTAAVELIIVDTSIIAQRLFQPKGSWYYTKIK